MSLDGLDVGRVGAWLDAHVPGVRGPYEATFVAGGRSNLTYRVEPAEGPALVLRRPPLGEVLASAHDVGREHRIIAALAGSGVPVPPALGLCTDTSVTGAPFYAMAFVEGHVVRTPAEAEAVLDLPARAEAARSLVATLAALHAVDPDDVGLGDLGRRDGYVARQLRRWHQQWAQSDPPPLAAIDEVHDHLVARTPEQGPAAIVHGDYRLDNTILGPDGTVRAVLDWELCTLGDPLADVGLLAVYWSGPDDEPSGLEVSPTTAPGFPGRDVLLADYAARTGRDVADLAFYVALAHWKLACILQGVVHRLRAGAMGAGGDLGELASLDATIVRSAEAAARVAATLA
jgi:aminoglycoside phosphotransferase (APT) family kinase protein